MSVYVKAGRPLEYDNAPDWLVAYMHYQRSILGCTPKTAITYFCNLREFFQWYSVARNGKHPKAQELREVDILPLPFPAALEVTKSDIEDYLYYLTDTLNNEPATRNKKLVTIRTFYDYLIDQQEAMGITLEANPATKVRRAKTAKNQPVYLPHDDQMAFLEAISGDNAERDYALFLLIISTGLRVSEAVGIDLTDLNLDAMTVRIRGKGNKERIVTLTLPCRNAIRRYMECYRNLIHDLTTNALFVSIKRKDRLTERAVQKAMQTYVVKAKLGGSGYTPHKLRHTTATTLVKDGADLAVVQKLLGHASAATTEIYTHLDQGDVAKALDNSSLASLGQLSNDNR